MLMREKQILVSTAKQIAAMYPEGPTRDRYITAAATLRIPYWDWAAVMPGNEGAWPDIISGSPSIEVDGPSGTQIIANPLYNYYFVGDVQKDLPEFPVRTTFFYLEMSSHKGRGRVRRSSTWYLLEVQTFRKQTVLIDEMAQARHYMENELAVILSAFEGLLCPTYSVSC